MLISNYFEYLICIIYKTTDYNSPWDGKIRHKGDVVLEDVYIYKMRVTEQDTKHEHIYQGQVSLVK